MTTLITADVHMTTNPREEYRFGLFSWLAGQAKNHEADQVLILGDLTEKFDRHPSQLVNRLVLGVSEIAEVCPVYIIKGNHDCVDKDWPFFGFLSGIPNVIFMSQPERHVLRVRDKDAGCFFLPSSDDPQADWLELKLPNADFIFMHQTVIGAAYDNGVLAETGIAPSYFQGMRAEVYSGDIHSPQKAGKVTYVGAPYRVDFGDRYVPRCLLLSPRGDRDLRFPCPTKHAMEVTADGEIVLPRGAKVAPGDHVRVRVRLSRQELTLWPKIRQQVVAMSKQGEWGVLAGPSLELSGDDESAPAAPVQRRKLAPREVLAGFSERRGIAADVVEVGAQILEEAQRVV